MDTRGDCIRVVHPLFQEEGSGSIPTSPLQFLFGRISLDVAKALNNALHSRLPLYRQSQCVISYGAEHGGKWYAAAIWSNPSSAMIDKSWLELKRMAIADDAPANTATRMIGWMVRDIAKRFPSCPRLISYQDPQVHSGTIYKAAGWVCTGSRPSGGFSSTTRRSRPDDQAPGDKIRWEHPMKPNVIWKASAR